MPKLSQKIEDLFDRSIGNLKYISGDFKLKGDAKQICLRPYPVLQVHREIFKNKVELLVLLEVFERAYVSEWV